MVSLSLDQETIRAIEDTVNKGDRVEVVPYLFGVKVLRIKREEVRKQGTKRVLDIKNSD